MDNPFGQRIPKLRVSLLGPRASHDSLNSVAVLPYLGRRLGRRYREARALSHASAIATCRCPTTLGSQAGLKPNAPAFAIRALGGGLARVGPKLRARAARRGPRTSRPEMALSVPSRIPLHLAPFGARECKNVVIGVRSQVGLIRHADQEISVRPSADRSSPYWVKPGQGGHTKPNQETKLVVQMTLVRSSKAKRGHRSTLRLETTCRRLGSSVRCGASRVWRGSCPGKLI